MQEKEYILKPCPFCGADAEVHRYYPPFGRRSKVMIRCTSCKCNSGEHGRIDKAVKMWNRRVPKELKDLRETDAEKIRKLNDPCDNCVNKDLDWDQEPCASCKECVLAGTSKKEIQRNDRK